MRRATGRLPWLTLAFCMLVSLAPAAAQSLTIGGTGSDLGTMSRLVEAFGRLRPELSMTVAPSLGSNGGIKALLAGELDLALSARPLKPEERAAGARDIAYGKTALTFVAGRDVAIESLTGEAAVALLTGAQPTWPDGSSVRIILRPESDTDSKLLVGSYPEVAAALAALRAAGTVPITYTDQDAADLLEQVPGAFGALGLSVILGEGRVLRPLALDGVEPTPETLANGSYRLVKTLYFVVGPEPNETARDFLSFVASPEGRAILEATGHAALELDGGAYR